jgi:hypothetical protein
MNTFKHTPGPWYADRNCNIWRRDPADLYQNGGGVAGDRPIATVNRGWYAIDETGFPVEANARLIASAPDLLEALQLLLESVYSDLVTSDVLNRATAAIAKATQEPKE